MRARNFANRKLLASSSPVEAQLFIHIRAIPSYSSTRARRIKGADIGALSAHVLHARARIGIKCAVMRGRAVRWPSRFRFADGATQLRRLAASGPCRLIDTPLRRFE